MARTGVVGWLLPESERVRLLGRFPPAYPDVIAHHVTLEAGVDEDRALPKPRDGRVVGIADDGRGVQTLVVEIAGTTERPDRSTYHITWSLDQGAGRTAIQSNDVIRAHGWQPVDPVKIELQPAFFTG